jgi:glycosyltransferase involved in cell wall biosynthesis
MSRIAVIISVYNRPDALARTLASVDRQTAEFEFFVVDDGSQPPLALDPGAYRHPLHLISLPANRGCAAARNSALRLILGGDGFDYVALQDAGDVDVGERMARQAQYLDAHPATAMVGAWAEYVNESGQLLFVHRPPALAAQIRTRMSYGSAFVHPATMIRVSALRAVGPYDDAFFLASDYEIFFRLCRAFDAANLQEVLVRKEDHPNSLSLDKRRRSLLYRLRAQARHFCFGSVHAYLGVMQTCLLLLLPYGIVRAIKQRRGFAT